MVNIGELREALLDANRGCKLHRVHVDALLECLDQLECFKSMFDGTRPTGMASYDGLSEPPVSFNLFNEGPQLIAPAPEEISKAKRKRQPRTEEIP